MKTKILHYGFLVILMTSSYAETPIDLLEPGEWYEVPNSKLSAVVMDPLPKGIHGNEGPAAIVHSWSGGAYDTKRERMIVWGGGHGAYAGNEVYAFDLNTFQWQRLSDPSALEGFSEDAETMPDGRPKSVHTYDQLEYIPDPIDKLFATGGSVYKSGRVTRTSWYFDFASASWQRVADIPGKFYNDFLDFNLVSDWDPVSGKVLFSGAYRSAAFDPSNDAWQLYDSWRQRQPMGLTGALDPNRRKFVAIGRGHAFVFDVDEKGALSQRRELATQGDTAIEKIDAPGLAYDSVSQKMVAWGGGGDVYTLDLDTLVWQRHGGRGDAAPPNPYRRSNYHGTFGRFRFVPSKNVFVVVVGVNENVFIYKPAYGP